jgi:hypothetical protein
MADGVDDTITRREANDELMLVDEENTHTNTRNLAEN